MSLAEQTLQEYLTELAAKTSTPGGGAVAALNGAQAAGLISMVANFSEKTLVAGERQNILNVTDIAIKRFMELADQDATNFAHLMKCYKQGAGIQEALKNAAMPPIDCLDLTMDLIPHLQTIAATGNKNLVTDTGIAASLLHSTMTASELNILINLRSIKDTAFVTAGKAKLAKYAPNKTLLNAILTEVVQDLV
jgi:formiminotetrahydrofolate cyclodeaminase